MARSLQPKRLLASLLQEKLASSRGTRAQPGTISNHSRQHGYSSSPAQGQPSRGLHSAHVQQHPARTHRCRLLSAADALKAAPRHNKPGAATSFLVRPSAGAMATGGQRWVTCNTSIERPAILPGNILQSPLMDVDLNEQQSLHQMVFEICDTHKDSLAVEDYLGGRQYTYAALKEACVKVASALHRKGYRRGDVLLAFAVNNIDYTVLMVACAAAGVWFSAANPAFTADELARQLSHCGAKGMCISTPLAGIAREALASKEFAHTCKDLMVFGEADGFQPFQQLLDDDGKAFPDVDVNAKTDVFVLPYSSGTTGFPKGVMLSHHNCVANVRQINKLISTTPDDRCIGLLPLYHIYGMVVIQFAALMGGASVTYLPKFEPESFLKCLQDRKITLAHLVPPIVLFMAKHPVIANFDLSSMKEVVCGAAPLGVELTQEFLARFPNVDDLKQGYGMTELSPVCNIDVTKTLGSVGHMAPNTFGKIVDTETNVTLGEGEHGELCVKGPQVMLGYYNNKQATDDMIEADGWLHTGDIASFDANGVITIQDRLKELIKYKGSQVAPAELEAILLAHPDIQDAAVLGVPDEAAGELPKAFVVPRPGSELTEAQVASFVEGKVAQSKKLRGGVQFLAEIPKNPSGKILRRIIKEKYL